MTASIRLTYHRRLPKHNCSQLEEVYMNRRITLVAASLFALVVAPAAIAGPQQDKMKACNAEAKGKKGAERKAFMKECLGK